MGTTWHSPHRSLSLLGADTRPREEFYQEHQHLTEAHTDTTPSNLDSLIRGWWVENNVTPDWRDSFIVILTWRSELATFPADTLEFTRTITTRVTIERQVSAAGRAARGGPGRSLLRSPLVM